MPSVYGIRAAKVKRRTRSVGAEVTQCLPDELLFCQSFDILIVLFEQIAEVFFVCIRISLSSAAAPQD